MQPSVRDINKVIREIHEAFKPLTEEQNSIVRSQQIQTIHHFLNQWKVQKQEEQARSSQYAQIYYKYAEDINCIANLCPDLPPKLLQRYIPGVPVSLERLAAERILIEKLLGFKNNITPNPCLGLNPLFLVVPQTLQHGDTITVTGTNFGAATGSLSLVLDTPPGTSIPLSILAWSDSAVMFQLSGPVPGGIPLHTLGKLTLTRADTGTNGIHCSATISVTYKPPAVFLYAERFASDSGVDLNILSDAPYVKEYTRTSPVLPARAEPFFIQGTDVLLNISSSEFVGMSDDPPSFQVVSGPSFTPNRERSITVKVIDDWAWNYTLSVNFIIIQPTDEVIGPEWLVV